MGFQMPGILKWCAKYGVSTSGRANTAVLAHDRIHAPMLTTVITYLTINSNKFTLNKNEYGFSKAGHIKMVCQIRGFYFREGQYGRIGTRSNSRADVNDCL